MTPDQYLDTVIARHNPSPLGMFGTPLNNAINALTPTLKEWGGNYISSIDLSGSYAKGTAISGNSDVDLFVSLHHSVLDSGITLGSIYENLFKYLQQKKYIVRKQNVSVHVQFNGVEVDIVPAVRQGVLTGDHSLWSNKKQSWIKANINKHINVVKNSRRQKEIKGLKIWRKLNNLDFPSIYLELTVIDALSGHVLLSSPGNNLWEVFDYLQNNLINARVVDPSNSNNVISDDLTLAGKQVVARLARAARTQSAWENIIW
jgi:predicted nucleotidyltransferase